MYLFETISDGNTHSSLAKSRGILLTIMISLVLFVNEKQKKYIYIFATTTTIIIKYGVQVRVSRISRCCGGESIPPKSHEITSCRDG